MVDGDNRKAAPNRLKWFFFAVAGVLAVAVGCGSSFDTNATVKHQPDADLTGQDAQTEASNGQDSGNDSSDAGSPCKTCDAGSDADAAQDGGPDSEMESDSPQPETGSDAHEAGGPLPEAGFHETGAPPEGGSDSNTSIDSGPPWSACYWGYPSSGPNGPGYPQQVGCSYAPSAAPCSDIIMAECPTEALIGCCTYPAGTSQIVLRIPISSSETEIYDVNPPEWVDGGSVGTSWGACFYSIGRVSNAGTGGPDGGTIPSFPTTAQAQGACPQLTSAGFPTGYEWSTSVPANVPSTGIQLDAGR